MKKNISAGLSLLAFVAVLLPFSACDSPLLSGGADQNFVDFRATGDLQLSDRIEGIVGNGFSGLIWTQQDVSYSDSDARVDMIVATSGDTSFGLSFYTEGTAVETGSYVVNCSGSNCPANGADMSYANAEAGWIGMSGTVTITSAGPDHIRGEFVVEAATHEVADAVRSSTFTGTFAVNELARDGNFGF